MRFSTTSVRAGLLATWLAACAAPGESPVRVAHLARQDPASGFSSLRTAFEASNPGYGLAYHPGARGLAAEPAARAVFVQGGEAQGSVASPVGECTSDLAVGDVICLQAGATLQLDAPLQLVAFRLPTAFGDDVPVFVRPDWDPRITDTPGGCATEEGAYRRILLTWLDAVGPYVDHALNAHRVRIADSFTHYHPREGGFDELYLVQMTRPGARLLTATDVEGIEARTLDAQDAAQLFETRELAVGDLVYLPRGTIHRGLGGALVQVITVPGFRPGAEIGVDHHLSALNEALGLRGEAALPLHAAGAAGPIVR
jgi:hypothetical protein